jgi:hypothetical protein
MAQQGTAMKTDQLPQSENVEDRRNCGPSVVKPRLTLLEQEIQPKSPLAKMAGVDDVKP